MVSSFSFFFSFVYQYLNTYKYYILTISFVYNLIVFYSGLVVVVVVVVVVVRLIVVIAALLFKFRILKWFLFLFFIWIYMLSWVYRLLQIKCDRHLYWSNKIWRHLYTFQCVSFEHFKWFDCFQSNSRLYIKLKTKKKT